MGNLCIIPARGGSKRIPRKNIKDFLGLPIIAYSIKAALSSELFDEVMVSTDDEEISTIAMKYGAKVPFIRSNKNSDDYASTIDVLIEVLAWYKENKGENYTHGCCLYPTAPFVTAKSLNEGYQKLITNNKTTVFPVVPFSYPIQRALKIVNDNIELYQPEHELSRSQDLEPAFHDAGQFYWFKVESILKEKKLWTARSGTIILNETEAQDIDTLSDWKIAELKFQLNNQ